MKNTDRIVFLYDELMTKEYQEIMRLPLTFISLGLIHGKLYFFNDSKKYRKFIIPKDNSSAIVFGGLFVIKDYEDYKLHLHSFYNSSSALLDKPHKEDNFIFSPLNIYPIKATSYDDLLKSKIEYLDKISCEGFIGNIENEKIKRSITHRYYKLGVMDKENFQTLLKER